MKKLAIFCFVFFVTSTVFAQTVSDLKGPIDIVKAYISKDGGVIGFVLRGQDGKEMPFCIDHRLITATRHKVYINAYAPDKAKRTLVSRSEEEKRIFYYLSEWLKVNIDQQTLSSLSAQNVDYKNDKKKYIAFCIKQAIKILRKKQNDTCSTKSGCELKGCCPATCMNEKQYNKSGCPEGNKIHCAFSALDPGFECNCYDGICMSVNK